MSLCRMLLLAAFTFSVQGCFVWIPGSVISSVSDSITGSEGSHCVGANTKVGDTIRLPGGGRGTVKSLSGTSVRCTNPEQPIRALLVFPDDNSAPPASTPTTSKLGLNLPAGWEQKPLLENMRSGGVLYATNRTTDSGALLSAVNREGITDLMAFANSRRANQASRLKEALWSEVSRVEVNGKPALRFIVTGLGRTGLKVTYMWTIIEGATEIAVLNAWTTAAAFEEQKEALSRLAENITGL